MSLPYASEAQAFLQLAHFKDNRLLRLVSNEKMHIFR
jgi:hypothetical protein